MKKNVRSEEKRLGFGRKDGKGKGKFKGHKEGSKGNKEDSQLMLEAHHGDRAQDEVKGGIWN